MIWSFIDFQFKLVCLLTILSLFHFLTLWWTILHLFRACLIYLMWKIVKFPRTELRACSHSASNRHSQSIDGNKVTDAPDDNWIPAFHLPRPDERTFAWCVFDVGALWPVLTLLGDHLGISLLGRVHTCLFVFLGYHAYFVPPRGSLPHINS
jgi:hypothetical protein